MISGFCRHLSDTVIQMARHASNGVLAVTPPPPPPPPPPRFLNNFNGLKRIRQSDSFETLFRRPGGDTSYLPVYAPGLAFSGLELPCGLLDEYRLVPKESLASHTGLLNTDDARGIG